jgi:HEAT repeat protein
MDTTLTYAVVLLAGLIALLSLVAVVARGSRAIRERRRERLAAAPRRALLAFAAEGGGDGADELVAISPKAWRAAEPTAVELLGKVRGEAHQALADVFQRRGDVDRARADLRRGSAVRRARAAEMLGYLQWPDAAEPIGRLLTHRRTEVRVVAVRALGAIGDPASAGPLLDSLTHAVPAQMVAHALSRLGVEALPALRQALRHEDPLVRTTALDAIGLVGATGSAQAVTDLLRDEHPSVRLAAAGALGRLGGREAVAPLLVAVRAGNPTELRAAAARALGSVGSDPAGEALAELLADPAYQVAHQAAQALRQLGPPGVARLRQASLGDDPSAAHAREALALAALASGEPENVSATPPTWAEPVRPAPSAPR